MLGMKKRDIIFLICFMLLLVMIPSVSVRAKGKPKLSTKTRTLTVNKTAIITLKNAGKTKWKTSKKSVVAIVKKKKNKVTIKAKKPGKATITATYKKKKYKITFKVKKKKKPAVKDNPVLNAADVTLYHMDDYARKYVTEDSSHLREYRFRVSGTNKEVKNWTIEGENAGYFDITSYGRVTTFWGPEFEAEKVSATVKAELEDGRILTATVTAYSELNLYIEKKLDEVIATYMTEDMTDLEKAEKAAWYAGAFSDYESSEHSWIVLLLEGKGDCMASRFLVEKLCRRMGIRACACNDFDFHGQTLVKIGDKYYLIITGFNEAKPRSYMITETSETDAKKLMEASRISEAMFNRKR